MVDRLLVARKLRALADRKAQLAELPVRTYQQFQRPPYAKAIEKILQEMVEICLDIAKHLIADNDWEQPIDSRGTFNVLQQHRLLTASLCKKMHAMVGFRNVLVHMYEQIDPQIVFAVFRRHIRDFDQFAAAIAKNI